MKTINNAYGGNMLCNYIEDISEYLKSPLKNNIIEIPPSLGTGFIKNLFLEKGFCLRYFNIKLKEDLVFKWESESVAGEQVEQVFKLIVYLESTNNTELVSKQNISQSYDTENSIVLYTTDYQRSGIIKKNTQVNRIIFFFTKNWLAENFIEASDKINETIFDLVQKHKPAFISEKMSNSKLVHANELASGLCMENFPLIQIKTKGLVLLNSFLNKLVTKNTEIFNLDQSSYHPEIKKIENRLNDFLYKSMPALAELAAEFNMSKATLQRHFKNVYGKSIYNYYLEKKIALGKNLIMEKDKTISEIAYSLGYNKINSFSKAFKKQYGILPSEVNYLEAS